MKKLLSILLVLSMVLSFLPAMEFEARAAIPTVTQNQQNIVDWADYYYNLTWECQKDVYGWREQYMFYKGERYRMPYAQAVNSGKYIGYGVSVEDYMAAAEDPNSVFYTRQAEWSGWVSVYYGTDCAAFVAMCWGTFRHDCSTFQYTCNEIATLTANTVSQLRLGDALDSYTMGHVVLVTDLQYDANGNVAFIEITEQTPPQLKRTLHTPESLVKKYGTYYTIYRYPNSVPAAPVVGYTSQCTAYASHCDLQVKAPTQIMSLPCTNALNAESTQLGTAKAGQQYVGIRLFRNTGGELWYKLLLSDGTEGYIPAEDTTYLGDKLEDITLTGAAFPQSHVKGKTFSVTGTVGARYNSLTETAVKIHTGFGQTGAYITGGSDVVSGNSYSLKNSSIDYATAFNQVPLGRNTYVVTATYQNNYAKDGQIKTNSGTVCLAEEYFHVVSATVSGCGHSYAATTMTQPGCDQEGMIVYDCATCGRVYTETAQATGHSYGDWTRTEPTCTEEGTALRACTTCGDEDRQILPATGHDFDTVEIPSGCVSSSYTQHTCATCGYAYKVYPEEVMSDWTEVKPEVDESLIQTRKQYRYRDAETIVSDQEYVEGCELLGSQWQTVSSHTNDYVSDWPSGFDKTHTYYKEYTDFVTEHQEGNTRLYLDGQPTTGYFYYHWCASGYSSVRESRSSPYTTFHVFYSTVNPADHTTYDSSDDSYKFHNSVCSRSDWYYVAEVSTQQYTMRQKVYLQGTWGQWSQWSDVAPDANDTRQIETRTLYRYADDTVGEHPYGQWSLVTAPGCETEGLLERTCTECGEAQTQTVAPTGHAYTPVEVAATCCDYAHTAHICDTCGHVRKDYPMSDWAEEVPADAWADYIQTKTQYRYSDATTFTSPEPEVEGATQIGSRWTPFGTDKISYAPQWPTGFDTTSQIYTKYHNAKLKEYEIEGEKLTVDSDQQTGYLYYHWCSPSDSNHYSYAQKTATHTIFHAYYSTVSPNTYVCDTSDMSYKTSDSTCSNGNSQWFFVTEVYDQTYTIHHKEYTHKTFGDWSDWSDQPVEATEDRKVETRTVYSWPVGTYGDHSYEKGICTLCGQTDPDYREGFYLFGWINGANYACEEDYENMGQYQFTDGVLETRFDTDSYIAIKLEDNADWFMTYEYVTDREATFYSTSTGTGEKMFVPGGVDLRLTLTDNGDGSLTLRYEILCDHPSHSTEGVCDICHQPVDHSYTTGTVDPTCTEDGSITHTCTCGHSYTELLPATGHSYETVTAEPTCTEDGSVTYTCHCGDTYTQILTAPGHQYDSVLTEGTCTEGGTVTHTCQVCGDSYTEDLPAAGHSFETVTVDPTCTEEGTATTTCTVCGESSTQPIPATGHSYETVTVEPTCTEDGSVTTTCTACGDENTQTLPATGHQFGTWSIATMPGCDTEGMMKRTCVACDDYETTPVAPLGHSYEGGSCKTCGKTDPEAVKDPGLVLNYPTLSFEDEIIYNVYFSVADTTSVVEMGLMVLPKMDQNATIADAITTVPGYVTNGFAYLAKSEGIPAANMGDTLYFKVYAKLTDGSYAYSAAGGYNAKAYASSILSGNNTREMKALVVSMLNYGAEAQLFFGHNTDKLVNDALTAEQQALVSAYDATMMDAIVKADTSKTGDFVRVNSNFRQLYPSVSFDGAFAINFYCVPTIPVDSGMTLYYWDMETMASVDKLSIDNASGTMEMSLTGGIWWGQVAGIAAKEMDKTYYVTCVFQSNGETITTGIIPYTLGKYCTDKAAANGDPQQSFAQATAVYGYYAKNYFASIA